MSKSGTLYYFTNSYPFGMGESWKKNELEVFSKYFEKILVVPMSYDGNRNPKELPDNATSVEPVLERRTKLLNIVSAVFFSRILIETYQEIIREKVFLSVAKAKVLVSTVGLIGRLYNHEIFRDLLAQGEQRSTTLYFFWATGLAHSLIFLNRNKFGKVVVRFHGIDLYKDRHPASYIPFRRAQFRQMHLAAPISESGKSYLLSHYRENHFDCDVFRLGCVSKGKAKESQDGVFRIFTCSSVIPLKRLDLLVNALALLTFRVHWTHIGDGPLRREIQLRANQLPSNVTNAFPGKVDPDRLLDYYAGEHVDIFVNVSESEGVPVSIMEAFSAGIPVLATNVGGTHEIVNNDVGVLLPKDLTPEQLALEIEKFRSMEPLAKAALREKSYKQYMLHCNAHVWAEKIAKKLIPIPHETYSQTRDCSRSAY